MLPLPSPAPLQLSDLRCGVLHGPQVVSDDGDVRSLREITDAIVGRRLRKLEGLRAYLRRFVVGCGRPKGGEVHAEDVEGGGESFRSPVSRLDSQQTLLIGEAPILLVGILISADEHSSYTTAVSRHDCDSDLCQKGLSKCSAECLLTSPCAPITHVAGFIKLTTQMILAIITVGANPIPLQVTPPHVHTWI